jgi:hypothetical protein
MDNKYNKKGIFCIEGLWNHDDILDKSSVLPLLELLQKRGCCDYTHHDCATQVELEFLLNKWKLKRIQDKYPILYLAFHGQKGSICLNYKEDYSLEQLEKLLEDNCSGKVIYFGSCSTLNIDKRKIKSFLEKTGAIAAIGYKSEIDWIKSAACDLFVFEALQYDKLDSKGIEKIYNSIISDYGDLHKILELTVVINDRMHFPRKRKK